MDKEKKIHYRVRAKTRAGRPNYSLPNRYYPEYMPATQQGKSNPLVGLWHMRRVLRWRLGYISIDGKRNDEWMSYPPEKIAYFHKLIEWADKKLKERETDYYSKLKEKQKAEYEDIRKGILSDVYDQTDAFLEKRKQCLNPTTENKEVIDMAKMTFEEMMEWSKNQKDFNSNGINWLRLGQGIHMIRLVSAEDEDYFRAYTQHDCGQQKDFRSWLCWDWIIDNQEVADYFEQKELLTEDDVKKAKELGDPVCNVMEVVKKYVKNMEPIYASLRTKTRCIFNTFYVFQAYPERSKIAEDKIIAPGNYILEKGVAFNKLIIGAMNKEMATGMDEDSDPLALISHDAGKLLAIQVEGEGIGKNKRTYTVDFKGKSTPILYCENGTNPFQKGAERVALPDDFQAYNLLEAVALRFLPYQEVINQIKQIPVISKIIDQIGYEIPGDEPSDNPLDDNYDKKFAQRTVGKPIKETPMTRQLKEDLNKKVGLKKKEDWEDEEVIEKEKKQVQSKKVVVVEEEEDIPFDDDFDFDVEPKKETKKKNSFEEKVPPSDPELEVITNKGGKPKRKIY